MKRLKEQVNTITKALKQLAKQAESLKKRIQEEAKKAAADAKKKVAKKKVAKKPVAKKKAAKKKAVKKKAPVKKKAAGAQTGTVLVKVMAVVDQSTGGVSIADLKNKTGLDSRQLSNALYKLAKRGKIKSVSRGVYQKA